MRGIRRLAQMFDADTKREWWRGCMVKNPYPARWIVDNEPKRPAGWLVLNDREGELQG